MKVKLTKEELIEEEKYIKKAKINIFLISMVVFIGLITIILFN